MTRCNIIVLRRDCVANLPKRGTVSITPQSGFNVAGYTGKLNKRHRSHIHG